MAGCVDNIDFGVVAGWAFDPEHPTVRLQITLGISETDVGSVEAAQYRQDLVDAGKGDGNCGFAIMLPDAEWLRVLRRHRDISITARNPATGAVLSIPFSQRVQQFIQYGETRATLLPESSPPKVQLSAVCIIKNEAHYVEEWIAYHIIRGVQFFLFFDNASTDNLREVLLPYIDRGIAQIVDWPNFIDDPAVRRSAWHEQNVAYLNAVRTLVHISSWTVVLDIDEFLATNEDIEVAEVLERMDNREFVTLYWRIFGSGGREARPAGLVVESFTTRAADAIHETGLPFKFMVRPEKIGWIVNTHVPILTDDRAIGESVQGERFWTTSAARRAADFSTIWINHYHVKSKEEYRAKVIRGWPENTDSKNFDWQQFFELHDRNEVNDTSLGGYGARIRQVIAAMKESTSTLLCVTDCSRTLIAQLTLGGTGDQIMISGFAFDCSQPGTRVRLEIQDVFCRTLFRGVCDEIATLASAHNFGDARMGFSVSLSTDQFPLNQVRVLLNGSPYVRAISSSSGTQPPPTVPRPRVWQSTADADPLNRPPEV
jgi:hypothetical protein